MVANSPLRPIAASPLTRLRLVSTNRHDLRPSLATLARLAPSPPRPVAPSPSPHRTTVVFHLDHVDASCDARAGRIVTDHGVVQTPTFMPVGTVGSVKAVTPRNLRDDIRAQMILGNTYHLFLRPGMDVMEAAGGLHEFMQWDGPILTDSGGFQVFSLSHRCTLTEEGVEFQNHINGDTHLFTPERVVDIQRRIGSDVMMVLDECPAADVSKSYARESNEFTVRWAERCKVRFDATDPLYGHEQALYAIVQGVVYPDVRRESARALVDLDFPGYAIGGLSVVAHAQCPQRHDLHHEGPHQHQERAVRQRSHTHRSRTRQPGLAGLYEGVPAPPTEIQRDPRTADRLGPEPRALRVADANRPQEDPRGRLRPLEGRRHPGAHVSVVAGGPVLGAPVLGGPVLGGPVPLIDLPIRPGAFEAGGGEEVVAFRVVGASRFLGEQAAHSYAVPHTVAGKARGEDSLRQVRHRAHHGSAVGREAHRAAPPVLHAQPGRPRKVRVEVPFDVGLHGWSGGVLVADLRLAVSVPSAPHQHLPVRHLPDVKVSLVRVGRQRNGPRVGGLGGQHLRAHRTHEPARRWHERRQVSVERQRDAIRPHVHVGRHQVDPASGAVQRLYRVVGEDVGLALRQKLVDEAQRVDDGAGRHVEAALKAGGVEAAVGFGGVEVHDRDAGAAHPRDRLAQARVFLAVACHGQTPLRFPAYLRTAQILYHPAVFAGKVPDALGRIFPQR